MKKSHRSKQRRSDSAQLRAELEFASWQVPGALVLSGWLIHNSPRQIQWGLLVGELYQNISGAITIYARPDLIVADDATEYVRIGFVALIECSMDFEAAQLTIGPIENLTQVCLPLSTSNDTDLRSYFPRSHQLLRFVMAQRISALSEMDTEPILDITNVLIPNWMHEIPDLGASIQDELRAGIDHSLCLPTGECFIEGWLHPLKSHNFRHSACLVGVNSSRMLFQLSAFRRPDITEANEFSGFALVAHARLRPDYDPILLLQSHVPFSNQVAYSKLSLTRTNAINFTKTFWSRTLDTHSINSTASRNILAFTREAPYRLNDVPREPFRSKGNAPGKLSALILEVKKSSALRNLLVLTLPLREFDFADVVVLSADAVPSQVWWPTTQQMRVFQTICKLDEALSQISTDFVLILNEASMTNASFVSDVRAAEALLHENPQANYVALTNRSFLHVAPSLDNLSIETKLVGQDQRVWVHLCKGSTTPPILARTAVLRSYFGQAWTQPSAAIAIRRFLKNAIGNALWLETWNADVFYEPPYASNLSDEQASFLFKLDAQP